MSHFQIPQEKPATYVTIRFPKEVVDQVKAAIAGRECTLSAFVVAAVRYALEQLRQEHI